MPISLATYTVQTWDSLDFFTVSLTVSSLAKEFDRSTTDITWGITLVLMLRSVGAILFGIAADRYGRKWPFVLNNVLFIILELVGRARREILPLLNRFNLFLLPTPHIRPSWQLWFKIVEGRSSGAEAKPLPGFPTPRRAAPRRQPHQPSIIFREQER